MVDKRNIYLDYLRGLSAILILLYHYTIRYEQIFGHIGSYPVYFTYGCEAVKVFFLLAGYFGIKGIEKRKPIEYAVKRFTRIYPVFWVCIIISFISTTLLLPARAVSVKDMLINFTGIPDLLHAEYVDGAYWTLLCELGFYFIVFMICVLRLQKHTDKLLILGAAVEAAISFMPNREIFAVLRGLDSKFYFHCFIAGGIIAVAEEFLKKHKNTRYSKGDIIKLILYSLTLAVSVAEQFIRHDTPSGLFFVLATAVTVILILINEKGSTLNKTAAKCLSFFEFIAAISYSLYLFHQNMGYIIISLLEKIGLTNEIFLIIPIGFSIAAAYLLNRFVEKPAAALSKKLLNSVPQKSKQ